MSQALTTVLVALLAGSAIAIGALLAAGWRQQRSLQRIEAGVRDLASGNYARRIVVPGEGADGAIADAINDLAEAVQKERDDAAEREQARRRLLANISHDLRTPITSIAGYADALIRGIGDDSERYLTTLAAKAAELARLTDDLFYLTRLDSGDASLLDENFDIAETARHVLLGFEREIDARGLDVRVDMPEDRCIVRGDASATARILGNIVANSLKHAKGMTTLGIEARRTEACSITIWDDGSGFTADPEELFRRGTSDGSGTGLGLAIARELSERMSMELTAESSPNERTAFTLTARVMRSDPRV